MKINDLGIFFVTRNKRFFQYVLSFWIPTEIKLKIYQKIICIKSTSHYLSKFISSVSYVARATHEFSSLVFLSKFYNQGIMLTNIDCGVLNSKCNAVFPWNFIYGPSTFNRFEISMTAAVVAILILKNCFNILWWLM